MKKPGPKTKSDMDRKHRTSITLTWWVYQYIKARGNQSQFIEEAVREKIIREARKKAG